MNSIADLKQFLAVVWNSASDPSVRARVIDLQLRMSGEWTWGCISNGVFPLGRKIP